MSSPVFKRLESNLLSLILACREVSEEGKHQSEEEFRSMGDEWHIWQSVMESHGCRIQRSMCSILDYLQSLITKVKSRRQTHMFP